ncbi:Rv3235 family protein [Nocardiopsis ansamitocini]|uniref:Uncharacterized protein n=1 Tax=Nocardiopsis ansamitocini TaxID=1670832 RepID=A0A9W6UHF0_9ACTN|nr:Rv3235 family protein [Nocardiopsis ansamitocini]GLU48796.1 hypothetical protein Nans01_31470 [Nocardiopsis ansamitocini]
MSVEAQYGRCDRAGAGGVHRGRVRTGVDLSLFAQCVVEVLGGHRSAGQLRSMLSEQAYRSLRLRTGGYAGAVRPRLRAARLRCPVPGVAEVSGIVACGARHRALAMRIAFTESGWLCTHIETDLGARQRRV